MLELFC